MMSATERQEVKSVLDFWFGAGTPEFDQPRQVWWTRDDHFDKVISEQFGELHTRATRGDLHAWSSEADSSLALVILLDQFSRNLHRGSSAAYANDPRARQVAAGAIDRGFDRLLGPFGLNSSTCLSCTARILKTSHGVFRSSKRLSDCPTRRIPSRSPSVTRTLSGASVAFRTATPFSGERAPRPNWRS
jgi:hypothetical protein